MSATDSPSVSPLEIKTGQEGDTYVVRLIGELDLAASEEAEEALLQAQESKAATILLDIDELRFIDSEGLRILLRAKRRDEPGGRLRVTRGNGHVAEMLRLTGLDRTLPFV